jgi:hypothetical protein
MLSDLDFNVLYLALLKERHTGISFGGIKEIQRTLIVSKTSDIVLLAELEFSEWDQDGRDYNRVEVPHTTFPLCFA